MLVAIVFACGSMIYIWNVDARLQVLVNQSSQNNFRNTLLVSDVSTWLTLEQIRIGYPDDVQLYPDARTTLRVVQRLHELVIMDLLALLEVSRNKEVVLQHYLSESSDILQHAGILINDLTIKIQDLEADMQICVGFKNDADIRYANARSSYDQTSMERAVQDAQQREKCIAENRVERNARAGVRNDLLFYTNLLQKKYDYIFPRQGLIVQYSPIMQQQLLQTLQGITTELRAYSP